MIYIFHGDDQNSSRAAFNQKLDSYSGAEILRLDQKDSSPDKISIFLNSSSLFLTDRVLALTNFFSLNKSVLDKLLPILAQTTTDIIIWQDKSLNATQSKLFPKAKIESFRLDNKLFSSLNQIKPHNLPAFVKALHQAYELDMYDLLLYLVKGNLRKQILSYTRFDQQTLTKTYLRLIELDFLNKTGNLTIPKEIALERILINLVK